MGLEEEHSKLAVAFDGGAEGAGFDAFDEVVGAIVPSLGEFGVMVAPVVYGALRDTGDSGGLADGCAEMAGCSEYLFHSCTGRIVVSGARFFVAIFTASSASGLSVQLAIHYCHSWF